MSNKRNKKFASGVAGLLTAVCMAAPAFAVPLPSDVPQYSGKPSDGLVGSPSTALVGGITTETVHTNKNAVLDWSNFDVGSAAAIDFQQKNANNVVLNRIDGGHASEIYGAVKSNGNIILANGNGIYFSPSSQVNVGGLVATTSNVSVGADGKYDFTPGTNPGASITNVGTITATKTTAGESGLVALVAPNVVNMGTIDAKVGKVILASGDTASSFDFYGDGLLTFQASDAVNSELIANSGTISANGGLVRLTAAVGKNVVDSLINMDGIIEAESLDATQGGKVTLNGGAIMMTGSITTNNGGSITLDGQGNNLHTEGVSLNGARLDAGNGNISIAGKGYGTSSVHDNYGVVIKGGSKVKTTGAGTIDITGTGGEGSAADKNIGVYIKGDKTKVSSVDGKITIVGEGGGHISGPGYGSNKNYGIFLEGGAEVSSSGIGDISFKGTGGGCGACSEEDYGVYMKGNGTKVVTDSGNITIFGQGGGTAPNRPNNYGVFLTDYAKVASKTGTITVTGVGGSDNTAANGNYGIVMTKNALVGGDNTTNDIKFVTDTIWFSDSAKVKTAGTVIFEPYTPSTDIGIAGAVGTLQLTETVLDDVTASHITIGNTDRDTGDIRARAYSWNAPASLLNKDGNIFINGKQKMGNRTFLAHTVNGNITLGANGGVTSSASGTAITLAASDGIFTNNNGPTALSAPNGRWLVYSYSPFEIKNGVKNENGGLSYSFEQYSAPYATAPAQATGNGFLYKVGLALDIGLLGPVEKIYDGNTVATLDLSKNFSPLSGGYTGTVVGYKSASYDTKDVGTNKLVTVDGLSLSPVTRGMINIYGATGNILASSANIGTITPVTLTVTADNQSVVYGTAPTLTSRITGFITGENLATSGVSGGAALSTTPTADLHVLGSPYAINVAQGSLAATNYIFSFVNGQLTVTPYLLNVVADNKSKSAGAPVPTLTYHLSNGQLQNGDTFSSTFAGGLTTTAAWNSAPYTSYPITQGGLGVVGSDYQIQSFTDGTLTVSGLNANNTLERELRGPGRQGPVGTLLSIVNNTPTSLANLSPAAGGNTPENLADLSPAAGGDSITPLIQCSEATPCGINQ